MAGARGCFNCGGCAWRFRVVARALCADACTYSPPFLSSLSCRLCCGADGDRVSFYTLLHVDRAQSKLLPNPFRVLRNPCRVKQLDTRLRIAPRRAHLPGKRSPPPLRSDDPDRVNDSRVSSRAPVISYNCKYCDFFSLISLLSRVAFGIVDDRVGGMEGHVSRDCTMEQKAKSCYRCGREGHIVRCVFSSL
jgi:Zinc knuckle